MFNIQIFWLLCLSFYLPVLLGGRSGSVWPARLSVAWWVCHHHWCPIQIIKASNKANDIYSLASPGVHRLWCVHTEVSPSIVTIAGLWWWSQGRWFTQEFWARPTRSAQPMTAWTRVPGVVAITQSWTIFSHWWWSRNYQARDCGTHPETRWQESPWSQETYILLLSLDYILEEIWGCQPIGKLLAAEKGDRTHAVNKGELRHQN